jgi:hypothetical protein
MYQRSGENGDQNVEEEFEGEFTVFFPLFEPCHFHLIVDGHWSGDTRLTSNK